MRIIGFDVGTKYIGVAASDEMCQFATRLANITRKDLQSDIANIKEILKSNDAGKLVVGIPVNMNGTKGPQAKDIENFVETMKKDIDLPILTFDERLTTVKAQRMLIDADISRKNRKKMIDGLAAQYILQDYLDRQNA